MKHKEFDDIIRNKLNGFEMPFDGHSWDQLEDQLDTADSGRPELEEQAVDELAFDRLHNLQVPYQAAHWNAMQQRLREEFSFAYKLYRYKVVELGVLALAIFTLIHLWPNTQLGNFPIPQKGAAIAQASSPMSSSQDTNSQQTNYTKKKATSTTQSVTPSQDVSTAKIEASNNNIAFGDQREAENKPFNRSDSDIRNEQNANRNGIHLLEPVPGLGFATIAPLTVPSTPLLSGMANDMDFIPTLTLTEFDQDDPFGSVPAIIGQKKNPLRLRFGMFGSGNTNSVRTSSNIADAFESFNRNGIGYSGGISLGLSKKRWEVELGMVYTAIQYSPWILEIRGSIKGGYKTQGIKNTELNTVSVPLHIRYNYIYREKWRMYIIGGLATHVAVQTNYYTDNDAADYYGGRSNDNTWAPSPPEPSIPSRFDSENLSKGWFEGGTFEGNAYFTGNIGLGAEYFLNNKWSVFAQPTYLHSIDYLKEGIGPNRDRINSINVLMGIKVNW